MQEEKQQTIPQNWPKISNGHGTADNDYCTCYKKLRTVSTSLVRGCLELLYTPQNIQWGLCKYCLNTVTVRT